MDNIHVGSSFDDFLAEEGIAEEVTIVAIVSVIAWLLRQPKMREV